MKKKQVEKQVEKQTVSVACAVDLGGSKKKKKFIKAASGLAFSKGLC